MKRITIAQVARAAGVSIGTASDALNAKGRVAGLTRERVRQVAEELGYKPSSGARGLATGRTMTLGLRVGTGPAIPDAGFFLDLLNGASLAAAKHGYALLITSAELDEASLVDGIIVVDPVHGSDVSGAQEAQLPLVTVGRPPAGCDPAPYVDGDHETAVTQLMNHLAERQPTGPAWLLALPHGPSFNDDVTRAFERWCAAHVRDTRFLACTNTAAAVTDITQRTLEQEARPTIVCAVLDQQAAWTQRVLLRAGLRIPQDVVIGSATDGEAARLSDPSITAFDAAAARVGGAAVELLRGLIERHLDQPQHISVEGELRIRESSALDAAFTERSR